MPDVVGGGRGTGGRSAVFIGGGRGIGGRLSSANENSDADDDVGDVGAVFDIPR